MASPARRAHGPRQHSPRSLPQPRVALADRLHGGEPDPVRLHELLTVHGHPAGRRSEREGVKGDRKAGSFDRIALTYDAWYETPLGRLVDRLEKGAVFGLLEEADGGLALDLSCGTGHYTL